MQTLVVYINELLIIVIDIPKSTTFDFFYEAIKDSHNDHIN